MMVARWIGVAAMGAAFALAGPAAAKTKLVSEDIMIAASDPGIRLFVRNKHPAGAAQFVSGPADGGHPSAPDLALSGPGADAAAQAASAGPPAGPGQAW